MKKYKNASDIVNLTFGKIFKDSLREEESSSFLLFVKDTHYNNEPNNRLSLVIVNSVNGYVINNDFRFNKLEVNDNAEFQEFNFHYIKTTNTNKGIVNTYYLIK